MAISLSSFTLSLTLVSTLLFFLLTTPNPQSPNYPSPFPINPHRSLLTTQNPSCSSFAHSNGLFNYLYLHTCLFSQNPIFSLSSLSLILLLLFYILIKTAQDHFSLVTTKLTFALNLTPSMAAVTLLALGNGAPDVFASVAARPPRPVPDRLRRDPLRRDVRLGVRGRFRGDSRRALLAEPGDAIGFVGFYLFFVGFVFWMDLGFGGGGKRSRTEVGLAAETEMHKSFAALDYEIGDVSKRSEDGKPSFGFRRALEMDVVWHCELKSEHFMLEDVFFQKYDY
ncbi:hypothetical protein M0R45_028343 [Rubus argutus]|uniref:Sodium/calcium exchanger membrane region domain-containing protein n=1 Tax=Rubus argutus TaxID=59490 RepID=A0AAW1W4V6_RUBAR